MTALENTPCPKCNDIGTMIRGNPSNYGGPIYATCSKCGYKAAFNNIPVREDGGVPRYFEQEPYDK